MEHARRLSYLVEPMNKPIPGLQELSAQSLSATTKEEHPADTQVTRLENGLRVASQEAFGQYSTVGGEEGGSGEGGMLDLSVHVCLSSS